MNTKPAQIRNASLYLLPVIVGNLVPLVTLPVFTHALSTEDFGAWALANAYAVVVGGVALAGLPVAYDRNFFACADAPQRGRLLHSVVVYSLAAFVVAVVLTYLLRRPITDWLIGEPRYADVVVWSMAAAAAAGLKNFYLAAMRNAEAAGAYAVYTIAERLLSAVLTVGLVLAGLGVIGLVAGQMAATIVVLIVAAARAIRREAHGFDRALLLDALKLGVPLVPRTLVGAVGNNVDKYLLNQLTSLGGVGIYSVAQRVATIGFTYMTALQNVYGPRVYARMFEGGPAAAEDIGRYLTPFAYVSSALVFLIAVFSHEILMLVAPPSYAAAVPIVTILSLYFGIQFFGKIPQIAFSKRTYLLSVISAISTALTMVLGYTGIRLGGTTGAAWGALAAGSIVAAISFVLSQRCYRIAWETGRMLQIFGLLFGGALLVIAATKLHVNYPALLTMKLAVLAGFAWLGVKLEVLTLENGLLVRDLIRRAIPGRLRSFQ